MEHIERTEKRKHIKQMNQKEILYIYDELNKLDTVEESFHAINRANERKVITENFIKDIKNYLRQARIIEFKEIKYEDKREEYKGLTRKEHRVLIGVRNNYKKDFDFKVVISLTMKRIITIWENRADDNHKTVDKSIYNKGLRIC